MKKTNYITLLIIFMTGHLYAQETLLIRSPSSDNNHITFLYAGDVWVRDINGKTPVKLTNKEQGEANPILSPDGKLIAFTGTHEGNTDVYVIPVSGGQPKRLTWNPYGDQVCGWNGPDHIVFYSVREAEPQRYSGLYQVNVNTGKESSLDIPYANAGTVSLDGKHTAYIRSGDLMEWSAFKLYRGGDMSRIWITDNKTHETTIIPGGKAQDMQPAWVGNDIYFVSDRDNHNRNIFKYNPDSKSISQITYYKDYDVRSLNSHGSSLTFEQGGKAFVLNTRNNKIKYVKISVKQTFPETKSRMEPAVDMIREVAISPSGNNAVLNVRGDIVVYDIKMGKWKNITNTPGVNEMDPSISNDGLQVAYLTDESGEYHLKITSLDGKKLLSEIVLPPGYYYHPLWSPDDNRVAIADHRRKLLVLELDKKEIKEIDQDNNSFIGMPKFNYAWSPDSRWLVYNNRLNNLFSAIMVYDVHTGKKFRLTDGLSDAKYPVFSADNKYIYFSASTNLGPNVSFPDISKFDHSVTSSLYGIDLTYGGLESLSKSNLAGIQSNIFPLPIPSKAVYGLNASIPGKLLYLSQDPNADQGDLSIYDVTTQKSTMLQKNLDNFLVSTDGKKILYNSYGQFGMTDTAPSNTSGSVKINFDSIKIYSDPKKEWREMFNDLIHITRDGFYAKNLHGVDLNRLKQKYEVFLPSVASQSDLIYLLREMMGEFVDSHIFISDNGYPKFKRSNTGLLGADYEIVNGHYRFKRVLTAHQWNPAISAPLAKPGINVKAGDYLLAVDGVNVDETTNVFKLFQGKAYKEVSIKVNTSPSLIGSRELKVKTIGDESSLRMMDYIETNRQRVDSLSGGKLAYVYLPSTSRDSYDLFNRYYFAQLDKKGLVIDTRFNQGGLWSDYFIDLLSRDVVSYFIPRYGNVISEPGAVIPGPKVMITNSKTSSGGDFLAYMFKEKQLGKLVGKTTFGMLNSFTNDHTLMNGISVIIPNLGAFDRQGKWIVENEGVKPDIEIDIMPRDILSAHDPQLEKAVQVALENIKGVPPVTPPAEPLKAVVVK